MAEVSKSGHPRIIILPREEEVHSRGGSASRNKLEGWQAGRARRNETAGAPGGGAASSGAGKGG